MTFCADRISPNTAEGSLLLQIGPANLCNGSPHIGARCLQLVRSDSRAVLISCFLVDPDRYIYVSPDHLPLLDFLVARLFCQDADLGCALGVYCCWNQSVCVDAGDADTLTDTLTVIVMESCPPDGMCLEALVNVLINSKTILTDIVEHRYVTRRIYLLVPY